jgi:hypothetical protein
VLFAFKRANISCFLPVAPVSCVLCLCLCLAGIWYVVWVSVNCEQGAVISEVGAASYQVPSFDGIGDVQSALPRGSS